MSNSSSPPKFPFLPKLVNGAIAGIIGVSCVFPLDLVKTRLQSQQIGPNGEKKYKNMFDCFIKAYRTEGYFGMYKGSAVNIILITPEKAVKLAANDYFRYHLMTIDGKLPASRQMVAGGLAGLFPIFVTTPMELLKIQMQDAGRVGNQTKAARKSKEKITARKIAMELLREKGIFGLYKGLSATMLRDITFSIVCFPLFATLNDLGPRKKKNSNDAVFWWSLLAGLGTGAFCGLLVTPLDVVKTRLQVIKKAEGDIQCNGIADCFVKTLTREGPLAFFKGGLCRMIVIAPIFGISQMVYYLGIAENMLDYKKVRE